MRKLVLTLALLLATSSVASAQVGSLIWSDEFTSLDNWLKLTGNGSWGWGNGELEYYKAENVDIADVPGETGNKALRIVAKAESGAGIVDEWGNPLSYTSGRLSTRSFVSVKYGLIEARVLVPDLRVGGWPAIWMMGTQTAGWPTCGEADLMEMGARQSFRNQHDTHNGGNGLDNSNENQMVGANAIWYSSAGGGTAMIANDPTDVYDRPYYNYANPLAGRFVIYRLYWDADSMRFTVVDGGVEHDLYEHAFHLSSDSDAFRQPFYLLINLAIGGAYTDAYQLGNPASGVPVSMPLPATMYVDYVRVYQWNGQGEVTLGPPEQRTGRVGLYTDNTPTTSSLVPGVSENIYVWESTLIPGTITPYEGSNGLTWKTNGKGWFGAGLMSVQPVNLFGLGDGTIKFRIKMPASVAFKVGIIDVWGNQNYVDFPAYTAKYGLTRNGEWGQASIPVSDIRGTAMDLRMLSYEFVILEVNGASCEFGLDDIYWEAGALAAVDPSGVAPRTTGSLTTAPNPFTGGTELRFRLPAPAGYDIEVVDASGSRVASLRGVGVAGANVARWDGLDPHGRRVGPGVYFLRMASAGRTWSGKTVVLR
jgi:beta-glucanase (GH16 family)